MRERSGEEGEPWEGRRVGESELRVVKGELSMESEMESPRGSRRGEYQLSWWALKSPKMSASPPSRKPRRGERSN